MDPLSPITPGPLPLSQTPVEPLQRISRERDRPARDDTPRRRREPPPPEDEHDDEDDGERPRIDVRV
jgi:hypothetical protein